LDGVSSGERCKPCIYPRDRNGRRRQRLDETRSLDTLAAIDNRNGMSIHTSCQVNYLGRAGLQRGRRESRQRTNHRTEDLVIGIETILILNRFLRVGTVEDLTD
jgi:hypothetical protein